MRDIGYIKMPSVCGLHLQVITPQARHPQQGCIINRQKDYSAVEVLTSKSPSYPVSIRSATLRPQEPQRGPGMT